MNLKTFTSATMAEGLALVRKHLGPHAVVLHTRTYKRGGILGVGARTVVEITAADQNGLPRRGPAERQPQRQPQRQATAANANPYGERQRIAGVPVTPGVKPVLQVQEPPPAAGDLIRRTYAAAVSELNKRQQAIAAATPVAAVPSAPIVQTAVAPIAATPIVVAAPNNDQLTREMRAMQRMVSKMVRQQRERSREQGQPDMPDKLFDQYLTLLRQEVTEELAEEVVEEVRDRLRPEQMDDAAAVRRAVLESVASLIPTDSVAGATARPADGRPRTIALIGPTGVGKTTTIAKLAATFKLRQKLSVGLITLDTYRIAAVEQLRTYANIIGVPLQVVMSPDELRAALARCKDCDVVLIDTAGRGQRDDGRLSELKGFIDAADPHEVHLVLSSTCALAVLMDAVEKFSAIRTDRIIFTKLDEAVSFGVLLNVARKVNKRLSYVTTGQEVPHQIEAGRPERLAALVLGGGI